MKIKNGEKLGGNLNDKTDYVIYICNIKEALDHGLVLKKVHKFYQMLG